MAKKKERLVHKFDIRYFFRFEVEHLLEKAGFEIGNLYGNYDNHQFDSQHSKELIFIAKKNKLLPQTEIAQ